MNLPPANILGMGAITPLGRDLATIRARLQRPAPTVIGSHRVSDESLTDLGPRMRRTDRFARMAAVAGSDCWRNVAAACQSIERQRIGLIVSTGFGPHCRGFKFLDGILDCGDAESLPTDFSHSVHGAAAAYITELLELRGPSLTTTDFEIGFEQAIVLAQCWLSQGICQRVLVGAVEEIGEVMLHCASRMVDKDKFAPGEGAVFFMLGPQNAAGIAQLDATDQTLGRPTTSYCPYFGDSPSISAFDLLGMVLASVDNAATVKTSCDGSVASLLLTTFK